MKELPKVETVWKICCFLAGVQLCYAEKQASYMCTVQKQVIFSLKVANESIHDITAENYGDTCSLQAGNFTRTNNTYQIEVTLNADYNGTETVCGIHGNSGEDATVKFITRASATLEMTTDKIYEIFCNFSAATTGVGQVRNLDWISSLSSGNAEETSIIVYFSLQAAALEYDVFPGQVLTKVYLGQRVKLRAKLKEKAGVKGIHMVSCSFKGQQQNTSIMMLENGCAVPSAPVQINFKAAPDITVAETNEFKMFKVIGSDKLWIMCYFEFCFDHKVYACEGNHCKTHSKRSRRDAVLSHRASISMEILDLHKEKSTSNISTVKASVMNMTGFQVLTSMVSAVLVITIIILSAVIIALQKKRKKNSNLK